MDKLNDKEAFGKPGKNPKWTHGNKDGVGTAYSASSHLWFTIWKGHVTEVYYPTIDTPQIRDFYFLVSDGNSFTQSEKKDLTSEIQFSDDQAPIYKITNTDPKKRYKIIKEVLSCPHLPCLLQKIRLETSDNSIKELNLYALCEPHLQVGGADNNALIANVAGQKILMAEKEGVWLALAPQIPFSKLSCGYSGVSDGAEDLKNYHMDWQFEQAPKGNVVLTGEFTLKNQEEVVIALTFGRSQQNAISNLLQTLGVPYEEHRRKYIEQWKRPLEHIAPLHQFAKDGGNLYKRSIMILLSHEDKLFPGAIIASLSIPFGDVKGDKDLGGYHLVWTRDCVQIATALLASGDKKTALRSLIHLAAGQAQDGKFLQNSWINELAYAKGIQLDEIASAILLAYYLNRESGLEGFNPYPMVKKAAFYLIKNGPATHQDRWEEDITGYSPSTLASMIAALVCAALFAKFNHEKKEEEYFYAYADFLESNVEKWTVTSEGTLHPDIKRYYVRINPVQQNSPFKSEDINTAKVNLPDRYPDAQKEFFAKEIVDTGFLALVRYGIRKAEDPLIMDSLKVIDSVLKIETPMGPCWRRYTHDGYGQQDNGKSMKKAGKGRAWPLLAGERGHYEISAKQDVSLYIKALEGFAGAEFLIAEQVWDSPDLPEAHMYIGRPIGSARPLAWAHAEYIKLLRSVADGQVYDKIKEVEERYLKDNKVKPLVFWTFQYQSPSIQENQTLRIQTEANFVLKYTFDGWNSFQESKTTQQIADIYYQDIKIPSNHSGTLTFTFFWKESNHYENRNYDVKIN